MKINTTNEEKLMTEIKKREKGCKVRTLDMETIIEAIDKAEQKLTSMKIPKKAWKGCAIKIEPEKVSNSYRWHAQGTRATLTRCASGWFMTSCRRGWVSSRSYGEDRSYLLFIHDNAKAAIPYEFKFY